MTNEPFHLEIPLVDTRSEVRTYVNEKKSWKFLVPSSSKLDVLDSGMKNTGNGACKYI